MGDSEFHYLSGPTINRVFDGLPNSSTRDVFNFLLTVQNFI